MSTRSKYIDLGGNTLIVQGLRVNATKPGQLGTDISGNELSLLDGVTAGTVTASKVVTADSNGQVPYVRKVYNHTTGATRVLTAADSGALIYLNKADGVTVTLPTPVVGMTFDFIVGTSVTSVGYKVITDSASVFIKGQLVSVDTDSSNVLDYSQVGNGSTHRAITMSGTTTGGLVYTEFSLTAVSATLWAVKGKNFGSGTVATPFATS